MVNSDFDSETGSIRAVDEGGCVFGSLAGVARRAVNRQLQAIECGRLTVRDERGNHVFGPGGDLDAVIVVHDPGFYCDVLWGGTIGAAEAYMRGAWTSPDLVATVRLMVRNRQALSAVDGRWTWLRGLVNRLRHVLNRNTREGSRRNIVAHYDLGDSFFELFLDESMMYSAAVYEREDMTLEDAQRAKLDRICRKLRLAAGDHLLEIGSGWGALACHAAAHFGCRVTTTTLSDNQYETTRRRAKAVGVADRVRVLKTDYRDLDGRFDKLVSIEMIEAVGWEHYQEYFAACDRLLDDDGMMLLQAITIDDAHYEVAKKEVDFIKRYIFPGSCIPSVAALCRSMAAGSELRLYHLEDITDSYALTLHAWRERFLDRLEGVRRLGCSEAFIRLWEFYLAYCEGGFRERFIGDVQMLLTKARGERPGVVGPIGDGP